MKTIAAMLVGFVSYSSAGAADWCSLTYADAVVKSSKPADAKVARALKSRISVRGAVNVLGPASREVGSGLHVFVWDLNDGSTFHVSSGNDLCAQSVASGVDIESTSNKSLKDPVPKGTHP